ncbi:MAG TPA: cupin domain-containing protein [Allosphingosinicella sp.]|nr:cupin domain-containing protein [Allosphingosinicella sp.]
MLATAVLLLAAAQAPTQPQAIGRTELQRHDLGIRGREAVQVRVDFSPGAIAARHRHPGEELVFVLRGTLELRIEGREPVMLRPGDTAFIPAGAVHEARNTGTGGASVLATYVVEKGRPLVVPVP